MTRKRVKISPSSIFERFYLNVSIKFGNLITWILKKSNSIQILDEDILEICWSQFLVFVLIIASPSSDFELSRVNCSSSHFFIVIHKILFYFSAFADVMIEAIQITFWNLPTHNWHFQQKQSVEVFCTLKQKATIFFAVLGINKV